MSSAPPVEHFKGSGWEECDDFILAIRKRAFWEGKQRDLAWIADFAATNFSRKALSWHSRLPQDVRHDWEKLEVALLDRWPSPDDEDEPQTKPTPAAARSITRNDKNNRTLQGVLKLVVDGSNTSYFVRLPGARCQITSDRDQAIRVRCHPVSGAMLLECMDHSRPSYLAAHWSQSTPNIGNGSTNYTIISCIDLHTLKSAWNNDGPFQIMMCTLAESEEVIPVWTKDDTSKIALSAFIGPSEYSDIYLAGDPKAYSNKYTNEKQARLYLEPID